MKSKFASRRLFLATFTTFCLSVTPTAFAGTIWDGGGANTNINTRENWDSDAVNALNGSTAATFATAGSTATINTNTSFTGITLNRDAAFTIADGAGSLTVGSGGITVTLPTITARTHTISESSLVLGANQIWSITNNTGAARLDVSSVISGATFGITKTGTGRLTLTGANTFGGGIAVHEGSLYVGTSTSALGGGGAGTVLLGNTTGSANATLGLAQSIIFSNPITVQAGSSGTVSINNDGFFSSTLAGTITLDKALNLFNNDNSAPYGNLTVSGKITGGSGLTLSASNAAGPITLSNAANDYTGATAINSGTVRFTGNLGNTAVTLASGATLTGEGSIGATGSLTFNSGSNLRVDGTTAGALSVGSGATGDLTLNATTNVILDTLPAATGIGTTIGLLNYNGTLIGTEANLALQNAANYRNAVFSTATANQVNLSIDTKSLTWSGGTSAWDIDTSANWNSGAEYFFWGDAVTFTNAGTTKDVTLDVSVAPASTTFSNSIGNDYSLTGTGAISGASSLTKNNTGTATLSTANTYTGGTTISGGKIVASVAGALGTASVTNNAILDLTGGAVTYTGLSTGLSGNGTVNVTLSTGSNSTILNGNYSGYTGIWNIGIGATAGAGKVQMNGLDNASATVNVLANGAVFVTGAVTKNAAIVLNGGDTGESQGQLRLEGGAIWDGPVTLAGEITGTGDGTVGSNSNGGTISGDIGETGGPRALVKVGASTITLSGNNTYTGATTVSAGTLKLGSAGALGNGTTITSGVQVNGTSVFDIGGISPTAVTPLTLNSTANGNDVGSLHNSAGGTTATYGGAVTFQAATVIVGGGASSAGSITLTGAITGNGKNLNKNGLGILTLSNSGTVTLGSLLANRGTIQVDSGTTLNVTGISIGTGNGVGSGLTLNGGSVASSSVSAATFASSTSAGASGTLTLNSGTLTVFGLTKGGTAVATFNANLNGGTLKATADNATYFTGANNAKVQAGGAFIDDGGFLITIGQPLIHDTALGATPDGGLTKSGLGKLTLSGANTYTGNTTVSAGTLELAATTGSLKFVPTTNGVSNKITGTGALTLKGAFNIDLTSADATLGNSWMLVDVETLAETFEASFAVTDFTESAGVWTKPDGLNVWTFKESTGVLTYTVGSAFTSWIDATWPSLSDKTATGDPDNDGMENLLEFVLNGDPSISDSSIMPDLVVTPTHFEFTFQRRDDSVAPETTQTFQWGSTLATWPGSIVVPATPGTVGVAEVLVTNASPADTVTVRIPKSEAGAGGKLFGRLQVTK
jgi:autotransporter-associated beta strand protein